MVTGIERWKEYFNDYKDKYVLIGGVYQIESRDHNTYNWYYGHFHQSWHSSIDGVLFKMLDIMELAEITP